MSRALTDESYLFTGKNEIETASIKSENENTPKNGQSTRCYHVRKIVRPPYLVDYVTQIEN